MKKKLLLMVTASLLLFCVFCINSEASGIEELPSLADSIRSNEKSRSNIPDFDMTQKLSETEDKLFNLVKTHYEREDLKKSDIFYLDILNTLSTTDDLILGSNDSEQAEFVEFANIYIARVLPLVSDNNFDSPEIINERELLLNKTYEDIKKENIESILASDTNNKPRPRGISSGGYSVSSATNYAKKYAINNNKSYRTFSNGDCTNFASQIVQAAGKHQTYDINGSGYAWFYYGYWSYSKAWTLAQGFLTFWTADYNYTYSSVDKSKINSYAAEGDFIAYISKGTYTVGHISYVNRRANGNAYVSQHSDNKYNVSFNDQSTSKYSSFVILRIS